MYQQSRSREGSTPIKHKFCFDSDEEEDTEKRSLGQHHSPSPTKRSNGPMLTEEDFARLWRKAPNDTLLMYLRSEVDGLQNLAPLVKREREEDPAQIPTALMQYYFFWWSASEK